MNERETVRFDLRPHHAMLGLAGLWIVLAVVTWPGTACWVTAALYVWAGWYARGRRTCWPADVEEFLAKRGWALRRYVPGAVDCNPPIPFRPFTSPELFSGAFKIMQRNWPTMIGVPSAILTGIAVLLSAGVYLAVQIISSPQIGNLILADGVLRFDVGPLMLALAMLLMFCAAVLPGDGLLISLGVHATAKAVRGEPIRFDEVLHRAKQRKLDVCRLASLYYLAGVGLGLIQVGAVFSGFYAALVPTMLLCGIASLVMGLLLSMSPVVLIVEDRGIADSFRRSIELCKPALGRIFVINLVVWMGFVAPLVMLSTITWVAGVFACPVAFGLLRCLPMLIYADLRMRQDDYGQELQEDWTRNTGRR